VGLVVGDEDPRAHVDRRTRHAVAVGQTRAPSPERWRRRS
jgi:hypothetical protein